VALELVRSCSAGPGAGAVRASIDTATVVGRRRRRLELWRALADARRVRRV
jgi:hypothetical protein